MPTDDRKKRERLRQIDRIAEDCLMRRAAGEVVSDNELIATHPQLMPELGEKLRFLRILQDTEQESLGHAGELHIRCPDCHASIELEDQSPLTDIRCAKCGSRFGLVDEGSNSFPSGELGAVGRFQLLEELGAGSYGTVWTARDTELDRIVAVKIPRKRHLAEEDAEKIVREARAAAQLNHPNIVRVHEVGRTDNSVFIVSDYVCGDDLADWLIERRPTIREATELCISLADALSHAHSKGIIHRDLKPSNVVVDPQDQPHLMDFGLAKRETGEVTMTLEGKLLGTPAYMSPEQARGSAHDADQRSDVYSLGVILFELLTGERPFRGSTRMLLHQILMEDAPSLRRLSNQAPHDLENVCLKCLEKDPERRYQTAGEFAAELRRFMRGEPVHARPIGACQRAWRWRRRNPALSSIAGALFLVTVAAFVAITWLWLDSRAAWLATARERDRAEANFQTAQWEAYRSNIAAASAALSLNDVVTARRKLEATAPRLRGWEWRFFSSQLDNSLGKLGDLKISMAQGAPLGVGFTPDGSAVYCANADEAVFWKLSSRTPIAGLPARSLVSPDGSRLATVSENRIVRILKAPSGELIADLPRQRPPIQLLCFSPDSSRLAVRFGEEGAIGIWDANSGKHVSTTRAYHDEFDVTNVTESKFSPDNARLGMRTGLNPRMILWDTATGDEVGVLFQGGQPGRVTSFAFRPDGKVLATGHLAPDNSIRLWNAENGELQARLRGHQNTVSSLMFHPDGNMLASTSRDRTARIWDCESQRVEIQLDGFKHDTEFLTFSQDGELMAVSSSDTTISLYEVDTGKHLFRLTGHVSGIARLALNGESTMLAARAEDGAVRLWNIPQPGVLAGHESYVYDVAFCKNDRLVASAAWDGTVRIWDATSGKMATRLRADGEHLLDVAISFDGRLVACSSQRGVIRLWDAPSGQLANEFTVPVTGLDELLGVAFNSRADRLAAASSDGAVYVWDTSTGELVFRLQGNPGKMGDVTFSGDDSRIFVAEQNGIRVWDLREGRTIRVLHGHDANIGSVAITDDGSLIMSVAYAGDTIRVWDGASYEPEGTFECNAGVYDLALTPDGTRLAAACADNTIRLWDLQRKGEVAVIRGHTDYVHALEFSPDGTRLVSGSGDGTVRIWDSLPVRARSAAPEL